MVNNRSRLGIFGIFCLTLILSASPTTAQSLRFDPDPFIPQDYTFSVPLLLESGGLEVKGVESIISFDNALVALDSITPGPWYTGSSQSFFFWDYTTPACNTIHFASAKLDGTGNADGIIAFCHFSFVNFGECPLVFNEVDVRGPDNQTLPFTADDGLIKLGNAVEIQNVSLGNLKAIYR